MAGLPFGVERAIRNASFGGDAGLRLKNGWSPLERAVNCVGRKTTGDIFRLVEHGASGPLHGRLFFFCRALDAVGLVPTVARGLRCFVICRLACWFRRLTGEFATTRLSPVGRRGIF